MANFRDIILELAQENGIFKKESTRSLILSCPECHKDKLYFDKNNGQFVCFSGGCDNKGGIVSLYSQIAGVDRQTAKAIIFGNQKERDPDLFKVKKIGFEDQQVEVDGPIDIPEEFADIDSPESERGVQYLESRGISLTVAKKFGIMYNTVQRRVVLPIYDRFGQMIAYQARSVLPDVDKKFRMLNNTGFRKGQNFMFLDKCQDSPHLIITEGPFDALKFNRVGGAIAALGNYITSKQIKLIDYHDSEKVYWAFDEDDQSIELMMRFSKMISKPSYWVRVPVSARSRIESEGKKVDFGECTEDECVQAISEAINIDDLLLVKKGIIDG